MLQLSYKLEFSRGHIPALDGLRGLAVLLVILHHCFRFLPFPIDRLLWLGWTGVDLFFVLSGFLISGILLDSKNKAGYYKNFIVRRTLRIFPLYFLVLGLFYFFISKEGAYEYLVKHQIYFWTYTQNLLFAFKGWPAGNDILNHFWSLAIEEQFYLFWPFVIWMASSKNVLRIALAGIVLSLVIRNLNPDTPFAFTFTLARFDTLLVGGILAVAIRKHKSKLEKYIPTILILSMMGLLLIFGLSKSVIISAPLTVRIGYTLLAIFYGSILISTFDLGRWGQSFRKVFESTWLIYLGKYSYGIYVYHWILYNLVYDWLLVVTENDWIATTIFLTLTLVISVLSYHLWEVRFLQLKKYFS